MSSKEKQVKRIFVTHAEPDRESARKLRNVFSRHAGVRVFTSEMLSAGGDWQAKLRDEITSSSVFIVLLSPKTLDSDGVKLEIGAAWALEKPFVIVRTHPEMEVNLLVEVTPEYLVNLEDLDEPDVVRQILELNGAKSNAAPT